jgi:ribosomal protein S18 acetylase RimI-like enzyme
MIGPMQLTYFKRYRMEIDLAGRDLSLPPPPERYRFCPWDDLLLEANAIAKYLSFRDELDSNVFPCLGELAGCRRLMTEIARKPSFVPEATWLLTYQPEAGGTDYCGTIQGLRDRSGMGAIQNVGITPEHRDCGLGTHLLFRSLDGFRRAGMSRVFLEVTAENDRAIRLYRRLGFTKVRTVFKAVELVHA